MLSLSLFIPNSLEFSSQNFTKTAHQNSAWEYKYAAVSWESVQWTCNEQVFLLWWRSSNLATRSTVSASKDSIPPLDVYIESILPWKRVSCTSSSPLSKPQTQGLCLWLLFSSGRLFFRLDVLQCLGCFIQFRIIHFCPEHRWTTSRRPKFASFDISTSRQRPVSRLMMGPF